MAYAIENADQETLLDIRADCKVLDTRWSTKKEYACPRGIHVHAGRPDVCGEDCRGKCPPEYRDKAVLMVVIEEEQITPRMDLLC